MEESKCRDAVAFIVAHLQRKEFAEGVFITFLCGYFNTYPKAAKAIARYCKEMGMIKRVRREDGAYWITKE